MKGPILYAEDDLDDQELLLIHLKRAGNPPALVVARNGLEAFEHLQKALRGEVPLPALVLADIKMPKMNGLELLARVRGNRLLADIPFALMTSSADRRDQDEAARLGADLYLTKPSSVAGYDEVLLRLGTLLETPPA